MKLSASILNTKLPEPFSVSFHTFYYRETVVITLSHKGFTGVGEAAPFKPITGDSQDDVVEDVSKVRTIPLNPETDSLAQLHAFLDTKITSLTLRAAIDFAYHDLIAKIRKIPVYALYAPKASLVDNSVTVLLHDTLSQTAQATRQIFDEFPKLKILKIKLKGEGDIERVRAIKNASPARMKYIVDANQGFTDPKKAVKDLNSINKILGNVILVEEPCPKGQLTKLKFVKDNVEGMLVFADESAATIEDAKVVTKKKAAHGINIKLQKAGGIWPSKVIAEMAEKADMKVMVGCMLEGPIGIAAGVHFAVSTPNIILSDLDADLKVQNYTTGMSPYVAGQRVPVSKNGLGVELNMDKVKILQKSKELIFQKVG